MKNFKQIYFYTILVIFGLLQFSCSSDDSGNSDSNNPDIGSTEVHSYHIILENGEEFKGEVPKYTGDIFYYSAFVEHNENTNQDILSILLYQTQVFNLGIGFHLDENNQPIPESNPTGISFNEWSAEKVYKSVQYTATLESYQKHTINYYGDEENIASFTLHFEGTFSNSLNDEMLSGSGTITIAAP